MATLSINGIEIEVEPGTTVLQACQQVGVEVPHFLLPRAALDRGQLPHVPGRDGKIAQADRKLRDAVCRGHGDPYQLAGGEDGARGSDGIPAHQPPAGLSDLRPGRRMRPAGPGDGLRPRPHALSGSEASGQGQGSGAAGRDHHDPVHPLHPLRPLRHRDRRGRGPGRDGARRAYGDRHLYRKGAELGAVGHHHRHLPGRRLDLETLRLQRPVRGSWSRPRASMRWTRWARTSGSIRAAAR